MFGLAAVMLVIALGAGLDLSRAYLSRQKLSQAAVLACQYASRPSVVQASYAGVSGQNAYRANVTAFVGSSLKGQEFPWTQTNAAPFTFVQNGAAEVSLAATVPTTFIRIINIDAMPIAATSRCFDTPSEIPQRVPDGSTPILIRESFETETCSGCWTYTRPDGSKGANPSPQNTSTSSPGYAGSNAARWYVMGYCVEVDSVGVIRSSVPAGRFSAELDCENGAGNAGNSSISTRVYLPAGAYELRYNYASRVQYPDYAPATICGTAAADVAWANATRAFGSSRGNVARSNQINVYLDKDRTGSVPTHTPIEGGITLGGSNLIDICVDAADWVERSVRITVTSASYYWLSFAADGANDSYGGQIDDLRLCAKSCDDTFDSGFPSAWLARNNGGSNKILFEDNFETDPAYTQDNPPHHIHKASMLNASLGTSGTSASGWPGAAAAGWATAPFNQVTYALNGAADGRQYIALDGWNSDGGTVRNRLISRPFLLSPGYYRLNYYYISMVTFSGRITPNPYCYAAPSSGVLFPTLSATTGSGVIRYYTSKTTTYDTNVIGAFLAHGQLVSTPVGGGALGSATSFANPNGTVSTTAQIPPDTASMDSYMSTVTNPILDICGYAESWADRSVGIKITKPGYYWLSFSARMSREDGDGGGIDRVRLTALGGLDMSVPPSPALTVPVPAPQPGATLGFEGFSIIANAPPPAPS